MATVGALLVFAGAVSLGIAVFPDWNVTPRYDSGSARWQAVGPMVIFVLAAGPVWSLAVLAAPGRRRSDQWRATPVFAAAMAVVAAVAVVIALARLDQDFGMSPAGPVAGLSAAVLLAGWLLVIAGRWRSVPVPVAPGVTRRAVVAAAVILILVAAGAVPVVRWLTDWRYVDHHSATANRPVGAVAGSGHRLWQRTAPAPLWLAVSGHHVLVRQRDGVRGLDPATGRERWRYLRRDARAEAAVLSADGSTVVTLFSAPGPSDLMVGLDERTGAVRWQRRHRNVTGTEVATASVGDLVVFATVVPHAVKSTRYPTAAIDVRNGALRWRAAAGQDACGAQGLEGIGQLVTVWFDCNRPGPSGAMAIGLSSVDGTTRWTWRYPERNDYELYWTQLLAAGPTLLGASSSNPKGFGGPPTDFAVDPDDGTELWRGQQPMGYPVLVGASVLYLGPADLVTAVDPGTGKTQWSERVPVLAGRSVARAVADNGRVVALLREGTTDYLSQPSPLRLITLDPGSRRVTADEVVPAPPVPCGWRGTGQATVGYSWGRNLPCVGQTAELSAGGGLAVVAAARDFRGHADIVAWG